MKKFLLCFLSLMLIFTLIPSCAVGAEATPVITVDNAIALQGETVNIKISITDNPGILAMAFCVSYDADALEYIDYQEGYLSDYNIKNHSDKGWISFVNTEKSDVSENGTMITLAFKIKDTASYGEYEIGILNNNPEKHGDSLHNSFANSSEQFIIPTVQKGIVTVTDQMPKNSGDVNDDGAIDNKDYALLMQYLNGWDVKIVLENSDVNGDDNIDNKDYALLMQYLNGWDVELK